MQKNGKNISKGGDPTAGPGRGLGPRGFLTEEEKEDLPQGNGALIKRFLGYCKPDRLQFAPVFVTIAISAIVGLFPSLLTGRIVDEALVGQDIQPLVKLLILALITLTASQVISGTLTGIIMGPSGSGRGAVVNLVPRLYDVQGGRVAIGGVYKQPCETQFRRSGGGKQHAVRIFPEWPVG